MKCDNCRIEFEGKGYLCYECNTRHITKTKEAIKKLPEEKLSQKAFDSLPEYSTSEPTGVILGKAWKRNLTWGCDHEPIWVICEYVSAGPNLASVQIRRPVVI